MAPRRHLQGSAMTDSSRLDRHTWLEDPRVCNKPHEYTTMWLHLMCSSCWVTPRQRSHIGACGVLRHQNHFVAQHKYKIATKCGSIIGQWPQSLVSLNSTQYEVATLTYNIHLGITLEHYFGAAQLSKTAKGCQRRILALAQAK